MIPKILVCASTVRRFQHQFLQYISLVLSAYHTMFYSITMSHQCKAHSTNGLSPGSSLASLRGVRLLFPTVWFRVLSGWGAQAPICEHHTFFCAFFLLILFSSQKAPMKRFRVGSSSSSSFEAGVGVGVDQNLQTQLRVGVEPRPQPRVRGWRPPHSLMVWFHLSSAIRGWGGG